MKINLINKLASERNDACVTISFNTHRTHPDNQQDTIKLKNLLKDAEGRLLQQFDKRSIQPLLENLQILSDKVDVNRHLDSAHIFVSNETLEVIRSPFRTPEDLVHISDSFTVRPLIRAYTRTESYMIMVLGQSGVHLYEAENDSIQHEITDHDFPFGENQIYTTDKAKKSDSKKMDDMVREYFNRVDKSLLHVFNDYGMNVVVVSTPENYEALMEVADRPSIYYGHVNIDYNNTAPHKLAADAWTLMQHIMKKGREEVIAEVQRAVGPGKVVTDLGEVYRAAKEGRGDTLIIHEDYAQPVFFHVDGTFDIVEDATTPGAVDDLVSDIAWEVIQKKGSVVFTRIEELANLGKIALKLRW
jgi:hypothetical protein